MGVGGGGGANKKKYLLFDFAKYDCIISCTVYTVAENFKTTYCQGKMQEFVGE